MWKRLWGWVIMAGLVIAYLVALMIRDRKSDKLKEEIAKRTQRKTELMKKAAEEAEQADAHEANAAEVVEQAELELEHDDEEMDMRDRVADINKRLRTPSRYRH